MTLLSWPQKKKNLSVRRGHKTGLSGVDLTLAKAKWGVGLAPNRARRQNDIGMPLHLGLSAPTGKARSRGFSARKGTGAAGRVDASIARNCMAGETVETVIRLGPHNPHLRAGQKQRPRRSGSG